MFLMKFMKIILFVFALSGILIINLETSKPFLKSFIKTTKIFFPYTLFLSYCLSPNGHKPSTLEILFTFFIFRFVANETNSFAITSLSNSFKFSKSKGNF